MGDWNRKVKLLKRWSQKERDPAKALESFMGYFRDWLIAVSELSEDPRWWHAIDWSKVSYPLLIRIAKEMHAKGCPLDENGNPTNQKMPGDPEWFWRTVDEAIFEAIAEAALEGEL
jgi:hypothetical protein